MSRALRSCRGVVDLVSLKPGADSFVLPRLAASAALLRLLVMWCFGLRPLCRHRCIWVKLLPLIVLPLIESSKLHQEPGKGMSSVEKDYDGGMGRDPRSAFPHLICKGHMEAHSPRCSRAGLSDVSNLVVRIVKWRYAAHQGGPSKTPAPYFLLASECQGVATTFSAIVYDVILRSDGIEGLILSEIQSLEAEIVNESILQYPQYNSNLFSKVVNELLARFTVVLEEGHPLFCERDMLMHFN